MSWTTYTVHLGDKKKIQHLVKLFLYIITENPVWEKASGDDTVRIPLAKDDWNRFPFVTHICPVFIKPKHNLYLAVHL